MSFSLASVIGAVIGATAGALSARFVLDIIEARLRALDKSRSPEERATFEQKIVWMRRIIMTIETAVLGFLGWWLGHLLGG